MTKAKVCVETTVISYLAAARSRDIVVAGHQETTRAWWSRRHRFELFVSQAVVEEASRGNADIDAIANQLLRASAVPAKAQIDTVHIAVAAINRMEYEDAAWQSATVVRRPKSASLSIPAELAA